LEWLRSDSIGQTGRLLCERLLRNSEYRAMTAARFFSYCYGLRSEIVHHGEPADSTIDLLEVANACQTFVGDLLLASFGLPAADGDEGRDHHAPETDDH
jgi:hypothetical protein